MKRFIVFIAFGLLTLSSCQPNQYGTKFKFDHLDVYYSEQITDEQVEKLHAFFVDNDLITDQPQSVQISKKGDSYILKLVKSKKDQDVKIIPSYRSAIQDLSLQISDEVFDGAYCEIHLSSNTFKTLEIIS